MMEKLRPGFTYTVEVLKDGEVTDREVTHNLMPVEGMDHVLSVALKGGAANASWYIGLYEGNYTPVGTEEAATFPTAATECVSYAEATRQALTLGAISNGSVDNSASVAEFNFAGATTVYGGFISSASAKAGTSGVLASVVRFGSPKAVSADSTLRVTAGFTFISV